MRLPKRSVTGGHSNQKKLKPNLEKKVAISKQRSRKQLNKESNILIQVLKLAKKVLKRLEKELEPLFKMPKIGLKLKFKVLLILLPQLMLMFL